VRPGDHVGLLAPNGTEFVEGFFGIALLGGVIVPLNARHKAAEVGYIADNADLVALLTTAGVDECVDFTEVLRTTLPSLADAPDPQSSSSTRRLGCAARSCCAERAGSESSTVRSSTGSRPDDPLHLRNHGPPEGLPAVARGHDAM
jgi:acyl-CoA synthetase (AMP-forming)/AMP-acid ligase II